MMYAGQPDAFDPEEAKLLAELAGDLSYGIGALRHRGERAQAEAEAERAARDWQATFDATNDAIWILDRDHRVLRTNKIAERFFHRPCAEMLGQRCWAIVHGTAEPHPSCPFVRARQSGHRETMELQVGGRWLEVTVDPILDATGQYSGAVHIVSDITERKRAEEALRNSEAQLRAILDATPFPIALVDADDNKIDFWSRSALTLFGHTAPTASEWYQIAYPDSDYRRGVINRWKPCLEEARLSGQAVNTGEYRVACRDGSVRICELFAAFIADRLIVTFNDITERKQGEAALRESEARFRRLSDATFEAVVIHKGGVLLSANDQYFEMFGYTPDELLGKQALPLTVAPEAIGYLTKQVESGGLGPYESIGVRKDGTSFPIEIRVREAEHEGQRIRVGAIRDISERKQAEKRFREQAALLDAANDAIYVRALDQTVTYWNSGAERLYGWSRAEALGRKITDLGDLDHAAFAVAHAALLEQGYWSGELKKTSKEGKERLVFCRWTLLRDEQGRPKDVLAINTDITEKKQLETQFLRAQRMEAIGALAGGIAHDLNNILTPILMTVPLLRETVSDSESREMLDTTLACAKRGADIIRQLLTFARGQPGVRVPLPMRHLLREMSEIIRETFPRNINLAVTVCEGLWSVLGDATQIHQALMNLCVNARDAMPDGGTLTLAAENLTLDEAFAALTPDARPGAYVCVSVTDTGTGIPREQLERVFDPFFTTKEIGKGTGLGLPTVLGIVRGHGGFVRVESRVGQGTRFEFSLPASPEAKAISAPAWEAPLPRGRGELVLVVDDEAAVRDVVQRTLEKHDYRVLAAADGSEALALFGEHHAEVKAVIADMMMPGMDGPALVRALRKGEPRLPILGMTGLAEQGGFKGLKDLDVSELLGKPFPMGTLLVALHHALTAAAPESG
jgi:PAS domain S-box-containing protein